MGKSVRFNMLPLYIGWGSAHTLYFISAHIYDRWWDSRCTCVYLNDFRSRFKFYWRTIGREEEHHDGMKQLALFRLCFIMEFTYSSPLFWPIVFGSHKISIRLRYLRFRMLSTWKVSHRNRWVNERHWLPTYINESTIGQQCFHRFPLDPYTQRLLLLSCDFSALSSAFGTQNSPLACDQHVLLGHRCCWITGII